MASIPEKLSLKALKTPHPEYSADRIERHGDLYEGGERFRKNIDKYLDKRQIEEGADSSRVTGFADREDPQQAKAAALQFHGGVAGMGQTQWDARKKVSRYTNYVGGLIDWLVSYTFYAEPSLVVTGGNEKQNAYWHGLNADADGCGTDLSALGRELLRDMMVQRRPFLGLYLPVEVQAANLGEQEKLGGTDLKLNILPTECADDWEAAGDGAPT